MIIAFSDLHFHKYKQFNSDGRRIQALEDFLVYLFRLAHKNGITTIVMPGDLFNNMEVIYTEAITRVIDILHEMHKQYPEIKIYGISGNHDQATRNTLTNQAVSALEALTHIGNFHLIDDTMTGDPVGEVGIWGIPYYDKAEDFETAFDHTVKDAEGCDYKSKILLMHQTMGLDISMVQEDIRPNDRRFKVFDYVLNGHIHSFADFGNNVFNVGSPIHRDAADIGISKGILVFDPLDRKQYQFMDLTDKFPQFIRKTVGEELNEWESEQYVIWVPETMELTPEDKEIQETFTHTKQTKDSLLDSFVSISSKKLSEDLLKSVRSYQSKVQEYANSI